MTTGSALVQTAYDYILGRILSLELRPGEVISDLKISRELDMSRTPVREALKRLTYETLVLQAPHNKLVVAPITAQDIEEITDVRMALEMQAIELILTRHPLNEEQLSALRQINQDLAEAIRQGDHTRHFALEDAFHAYLLDASGNSRLPALYRQFQLLILRARWLTLFEPHHEATIREHEAIIDAIGRRDLPAAQAALRTHLVNSRTNFCRVFARSDVKAAAAILSSVRP